MRVMLFTGKGGVGKTTAAAGTAIQAGLRGLRTLVVSTDAAHSLADAFETPIGPDPTEVDSFVWVQHVDAQRRFEQSWTDIQRYLLTVLDAAGVDPIAAEELTVLPGAEEVLALLEVRDQVATGAWDLVIVDCAPTAETLRLLSLPEALTWYMERIFPVERRVIKTLRPMLARAAGVPMPHDTVFDAVERLHRELAEVRDVLTGPDASVRLVLTPESVVVAEARRAFTTLSLYGYRVDGVIANRIFPSANTDTWRQQWVAAQRDVLAEVERSFAPLPIWRSGFRASEPVGCTELAALGAELYGNTNPFAPVEGDGPMRVERDGENVHMSLALPFADRPDVDVVRHGRDLVVTVGSYRRVIALPTLMQRCRVAGARLRDGWLHVRFRPEPDATDPDPTGGDSADSASAVAAASEVR